jgi:hypothetical protein
MGSNVFANGMEIASVASDGKSIAAMPDVCYTPPQAPPTPTGVPIPYPNTGMASDLTGGSTTVMVGGNPVCLKDKSSFKKTSGDEAGSAPLKGVVSMSNAGAVFFAAWSMNVKIEGENVVRHLDIGTHNHASQVGNAPPWPFLATMKPAALSIDDPKCKLRPYKPDTCPEGTTGHHCIPDHCFRAPGKGGARYPGAVSHSQGLCVCVTGSTKSTTPTGGDASGKDYAGYEEHYAALAEHGRIHKVFDALEAELGAKGKPQNSASLGALEDNAAATISVVTGCDERNVKQQLRQYHQEKGLGPDTRLRADPGGKSGQPDFEMMGTLRSLGD